jgi:hypothetical protein
MQPFKHEPRFIQAGFVVSCVATSFGNYAEAYGRPLLNPRALRFLGFNKIGQLVVSQGLKSFRIAEPPGKKLATPDAQRRK